MISRPNFQLVCQSSFESAHKGRNMTDLTHFSDQKISIIHEHEWGFCIKDKVNIGR